MNTNVLRGTAGTGLPVEAGARCTHGSRPGAKIFRGKVLPGNFAQIVVYISRIDGVVVSLFIDVLE